MKRLNANASTVWQLLSLLLVFSLLAACQPVPPLTPGATVQATSRLTPTPRPGTPGGPAVSPAAPTATQVVVTPTSAFLAAEAELRGSQVRFWHPWAGPTGAAVDEMIRRFNVTNTWGIWVQVERHASLDELNTNLETALEAKALPDLAVAYPYRAVEWETRTDLVRLDPYIQDPRFGFSEAEQVDFYPVFWEQDILGGERFGLPAFRSGQLLYYNQTWAQELGFDQPPANQAQFRQQACAAARALRQAGLPGSEGMGGYLLSLNYSAMLGWMTTSGAEIESVPGGYQFATPDVTDTFHFLRKMYDDGCAWLADGYPADDEFALGHALFIDGSITGIPNQQAMFQRTGSQDVQWTVLPFPGVRPGDSHQGDIQVYGPSYVMFQSSPARQLAAWIFMKWLLEPENHAQFAAASGTFPVRAASLDHLTGQPPQWWAAVDLLPQAQAEPIQPSWGLVRWAVFDASTQLFRYYFTIDQVPALVKLLDETAAGLHAASQP